MFLLATVVAFLFGLQAASAQTVHPYDKYLQRIDLGLQGVGEYNKAVSGTVFEQNAPNANTVLTDSPSNTLGFLATVRYVVKPYVGFEFNGGYARYTQNFSLTGGIQANADEFTLGYLVTPPHLIYGLQPYASIGTGSIEFKPTPRGGQSLNPQARQVYYYNLGFQKDFYSHLGVRAGFRQLVFLAPDFGQNYLTIKQHTTTYEPLIGFYIKF